ncbi:heme exporter protein CcmD [Thalassotalea ganghwensis]
MQFNSFSEFIAMGNHGFYIWLSFGITFVLMALLLIFTQVNDKNVRKQIMQRDRREQKLKRAAQQQEFSKSQEESL